MKQKLKIVALISPIIFALDHLTKWIIVKNIPVGNTKIVVWDNFFDIVHYRNTGAAFSLFADMNPAIREPFFYTLSLVAMVVLFYFLKQLTTKILSIPLAMIFGGALGNITDRIFRGSVVDFLSFHWYDKAAWPAFNVADSAITVGVVWLVIGMGFGKKKN